MINKESLFRLILVLISIFIALIIAEAGCRLLLVNEHQYSVSATGNQYEFYQFDPKLGWSNTPGASGVYRRREFAYRITINEHGMRQHQVAKKKESSTFRIAVLGDSFVWGIGVNDEDRLTELLEEMLPNVEVLNFGTSGYSPVQYLLMIDDIIEFEPDMVVIVFCLDNDFDDNVFYQRYGYYKPYASLDRDGSLIINGYPLPDVRKFGFQKKNQFLGSVLLGELWNKYLVSNLDQEGLIGFSDKLLHIKNKKLSSEQKYLKSEALRINESVLAKIQSTLHEKGIPLIISSAPSKREYNKDGKYGHQGYYPLVERELQRSTTKLGIAFIPNVNNLNGNDFWVNDGHWNPSGHKKMAASIASYITDREFLLVNKTLQGVKTSSIELER